MNSPPMPIALETAEAGGGASLRGAQSFGGRPFAPAPRSRPWGGATSTARAWPGPPNRPDLAVVLIIDGQNTRSFIEEHSDERGDLDYSKLM